MRGTNMYQHVKIWNILGWLRDGIYLGHKYIWVLAYIPILGIHPCTSSPGQVGACDFLLENECCINMYKLGTQLILDVSGSILMFGIVTEFFLGLIFMGLRAVPKSFLGTLGNIIPRDIGWRFITTFGSSRHLRLWKTPEIETENGHKWLSAMSKDHLANPEQILTQQRVKIYSGFQSGQSHKRATMVVQSTVPELMWALPNGTKIMTQHLECFDNMMQFLRIKFSKLKRCFHRQNIGIFKQHKFRSLTNIQL